jgi:ATPase subunit of ABC transporter with duplicated ATPase domains
MVSHDRTLLEQCDQDRVHRRLGLPGCTAARTPRSPRLAPERQEKLGDELKRWNDEERRLFQHMKIMKQRAAQNFKNATKANAAETRWEKFVAAGPPPPPVPTSRSSCASAAPTPPGAWWPSSKVCRSATCSCRSATRCTTANGSA